MSKSMRVGSGRSGLFLMELILAIGFFALTSAVCVQIFARAHLISRESGELTHAMLWCQSAAESFKATDGDLAGTAALLGAERSGQNSLSQDYGADFQCDPPEHLMAPYRLTLTASGEDELKTAEIAVFRRGQDGAADEIYHLQVKALAP
ncbi:MAG: hypothetical protein RR320_03185 [Oscillospiraceae bacterium]